jgi:hypothetical protein
MRRRSQIALAAEEAPPLLRSDNVEPFPTPKIWQGPKYARAAAGIAAALLVLLVTAWSAPRLERLAHSAAGGAADSVAGTVAGLGQAAGIPGSSKRAEDDDYQRTMRRLCASIPDPRFVSPVCKEFLK